MQYPETLAPIERFLTHIGVSVHKGRLAPDSFLPGVAVRAGGLVVDPDLLGSPGDILHEAGHVAVTPSRLRPHLNGDIDACAAALIEDPDMGVSEDEAKIIRHTETAAIAWSYAAALASGIAPESVFWGEGYGGKQGGAPQAVMFQVAQGFFPGIQALSHEGFCTAPPPFGDMSDPTPFPHMKRWLAA